MVMSLKREPDFEEADEAQKRLKPEPDNEDRVVSNDANDTESTSKRRRGKRHKYVMLSSYSGRAYYGMQIQNGPGSFPTIEAHLFDVLFKLRFINDEERTNPKRFWFQRAARTDKGVSAVGQVCSLILPLRDRYDETDVPAGIEGHVNYTPVSLVDAMNDLLPEDIRVHALQRATKNFDAKNACQARTYAYMLPSYAFSRKDEDPTTFRITDERLTEVNELLWSYQGTHNFFNFTCKRSADDVSCNRYVMRCKCDQPIIKDGMELLTIHLKGQSFMLHQIRKMIGLCIAVIRGIAEKNILEMVWRPIRCDVPIAPSLGLALEEVHYDSYNQKYEKTHQPLDWTLFKNQMDDFRERYIDSVVIETEKKERTMLEWLKTLEYHNFDSTSTVSYPLQLDKNDVMDEGDSD